MTRQQKTEKQRAQERLDIAQRRVDRCKGKITALEAEAQVLRAELVEHEEARDYFAQAPSLQTPATIAVDPPVDE